MRSSNSIGGTCSIEPSLSKPITICITDEKWIFKKQHGGIVDLHDNTHVGFFPK